MNSRVDHYLTEGCGRCDLYQTEACKVHPWQKELNYLRSLLLESDLKEEVKWSVPTYTLNGANVVILSALKNYVSLSFLKGSILKDPTKILEFAGPNSRVAKLVKVADYNWLQEHSTEIKHLIKEAIAVEKRGDKVEPSQDPSASIPGELEEAFERDPKFKAAFEALSPGRQRGYIINFTGAKQSKTRWARIERWKPHVLDGKGIHDR